MGVTHVSFSMRDTCGSVGYTVQVSRSEANSFVRTTVSEMGRLGPSKNQADLSLEMMADGRRTPSSRPDACGPSFGGGSYWSGTRSMSGSCGSCEDEACERANQ
ncbi:unnamed protein product [Durusdinium trenchii]|uniref:Uncharacterized protein n=1 Tax=Durusdinium trenchii TaxID=1381693 RepID=A0ABP0M6A9_9DINO